ncbi:MAG: patatin-like phospholipase family protein [Pseudohongiellaceae bacterium]
MDIDIADDVRSLRNVISKLPLFRELADDLLESIAEEIEWFALPGGTTLFEAGEEADGVYFVITGCLGAYAVDGQGSNRLLGHIVAGEPVGEMALISGKPRNATVIALRDSELGRWSKPAFEKLMQTHPRELLHITRLIVQRLENSQRLHGRTSRAALKTFSVVPHSADVDTEAFTEQLVACLGRYGRTALIRKVYGTEYTSHWFHTIERNHAYVVYVTDSQPTAWTRLCLRQSDSVLLLANAAAEAHPWPALANSRQPVWQDRRVELLLLNSQGVLPGAAARWLAITPDIPHHHIGNGADISRLSRLITGRALGLTLSGGGARGFAHIGVMRALLEAGIPIDTVGGTSIGAIIAGGIAAGWDYQAMVFHMKRSFVTTNPLDDYTFPLVSLVAGRKVSRLLRQEFSDVQIEDLYLPYFCVSANLTSGQCEVHRRGELWRGLRASVAIPGVLPPVFSKGQVLVDGATINNLPVDIMRQQGRGLVIGVDLGGQQVFTADADEGDGPPFWKFLRTVTGREKHINIFQVLLRAGMINSTTNTATVREHSDILLQPSLANVDLLNWQAFDTAVEAGYRHTMERLESIKAMLKD